MKDTIYRQAAIDLFPNDTLEWDTNCGYIAPHLARQMIEELPSAQPDLSEYSDKLWRNAYERGKRDAQPEISVKMTNADKFKQMFGIYATELWAMPERDFLEWLNDNTQLEPHWIPCKERMPNKDGAYLVSGRWASGKESVGDCDYSKEDGYFHTAWNFDVLAWCELPEPYREEGDE